MARAAQTDVAARPGGRARGGAGLESVRIALESLRTNKLRTVLTMLGIIIGVWSVVSLLAVGNGVRQSITRQLQNTGTNLLLLQPGTPRGNRPAANTQPLTMADAEALGKAIPEIAYVPPEYQNRAQIVVGPLNRNVSVLGVTPEFALVPNVTVARGQFVTEEMVRSARSVAVLGGKLAEDIYGSSDPIGQTIRIKGRQFKVVGVLKVSGGFGGNDNGVLVPITTAYRVLFGGRSATSTSHQVSMLSLQVRSADEIDLAQAKVEQVMRRRHKLADDGESDDFAVVNQATLLESFSTVTTTLTVFLGTIAGISLVVGGIGVMNIMLVSVAERTKEIGLRKAVGAKRRDILRQFLVEALLVSIFGGMVGLALAYITSTIIGMLFSEYVTPIVTLSSVLLAFSFSAAVGLFFGIYPAQRAARLNPIQALRYE